MALFQDLIVTIARLGENGEASLFEANRQIVRLHRLGMFHDTMILDPDLWRRPYGNTQSEVFSGLLIQAALYTPKGIGAVRWDTEEYEASQHARTLEADAVVKFQPAANCRAAVRAFLNQHSHTLIELLCKEYDIAVHNQTK